MTSKKPATQAKNDHKGGRPSRDSELKLASELFRMRMEKLLDGVAELSEEEVSGTLGIAKNRVKTLMHRVDSVIERLYNGNASSYYWHQMRTDGAMRSHDYIKAQPRRIER